MQKAVANVALEREGGLQEPSDRNCPRRRKAEAGYHRCHGEGVGAAHS